jgi:hypothetical protein
MIAPPMHALLDDDVLAASGLAGRNDDDAA